MTKVLIVAGGKGERLRPITDSIPKPMVNVGPKPVLEYNLALFKKYGFKDFIFALCYLPDIISDYFGDGTRWAVRISYTYEDPNTPLGTAGAITLAKEQLKETFIVTYGDSIRFVDVSKMLQFHKEKKAFATICVYERSSQNAKSMVVMNSNGFVDEFKERPNGKELTENSVWSNAAMYIFEPEIFEYIPENQMIDFGKDIFPKLIKEKKQICAFPMEGYFIDIGNKEKLDKANEDFSKGLIKF